MIVTATKYKMGAKHTSSGDETPPIPEEELEQQRIEHELQMQKEKECQAREAEEDRKLDIELLHQRAIEAEAEQKREIAEAVEAVRGLNTSWSHHGLCELPRMATRWRHSRPSIPDTHYRNIITQNMLKKACSAQLTKPHSIQSITECDNWINLSRLGTRRDESIDSDVCCGGVPCEPGSEARAWRASTSDVRPQMCVDMDPPPSCFGQVNSKHFLVAFRTDLHTRVIIVVISAEEVHCRSSATTSRTPPVQRFADILRVIRSSDHIFGGLLRCIFQ